MGLLDLLGFAGQGQEDGAQGKRAELNVFYGAEDTLNVSGGFLVVEAGIDEANYGAGGFGLKPSWRQG